MSTSLVLERVNGRKTTGCALHEAARRFYGAWDNALEQAGIPVPSIKEKTFWTKEKIIGSIRELDKHGFALNSTSVDKIVDPRGTVVIKDLIGKERHTKSLYGGAIRTFGSWDRALEISGLKPDVIRLRPFRWTKTSLGRALQVLHKSGVPLNAGSISRDNSEKTNSIILERLGREVSGRQLYGMGLRKLGSWDATIKYSGFFVSTIRKRGTSCERNQEKLIRIIRSLSFHEFRLNSSAVSKQSQRVRLFNEIDFDCDISGQSLLKAAKELFSSWQEALWESGLDPSSICLRSNGYTSNLPILSLQKEDMKIPTGERRLVSYIGQSKTPDQVLEEQETANRLHSALGEFSGSEQELLEMIFDEVLRIHHYKDQKQLIDFLIQKLGSTVSAETISQLFAQLAENLKRSA